jgi:hypothetical protein
MSTLARLKSNLEGIHRDVDAACHRARRDPAGVRLVAVTKYASLEHVQTLSRLHDCFGENRPQQLAERQPLLPSAEWHLIGQLQRNKVKLAIQHASLIHSVDSLRLLESIAAAGTALSVSPRVLLQVNASGEAAKSGFALEELPELWPRIVEFAHGVRIDGLMTMAAEVDDPELARPVFRALRQLRDRLRDRPESGAARINLAHLSMGMSGDFVPAVEEGATLIRIGSRIFSGLNDTPENQ